MDKILVFSKNKLLYEFVETVLMFGGENRNKQFQINEIDNFLPEEICEIYRVWRKKSNLDGDNETMNIEYKGLCYTFINHYWD